MNLIAYKLAKETFIEQTRISEIIRYTKTGAVLALFEISCTYVSRFALVLNIL